MLLDYVNKRNNHKNRAQRKAKEGFSRCPFLVFLQADICSGRFNLVPVLICQIKPGSNNNNTSGQWDRNVYACTTNHKQKVNDWAFILF